MTFKEKRIFFNWLQKHDALEAYKRNRFVFMREYRRHGWTRPYKYAYLEAFDALSLAFSWSNTPEGQEYWYHLGEIWASEFRWVMGRML